MSADPFSSHSLYISLHKTIISPTNLGSYFTFVFFVWFVFWMKNIKLKEKKGNL